MAVIKTWYNQDLSKPVEIHYLKGNVFSQDNAGNLIGVNVFENGEPASLSGTVSASIIRSDGATVAVSGTLSGNQCSVSLPQAAYYVPGVLSIVIKLTSGTTVTTLCAVVANVYRSATDATVDPGTIIPDVSALIASIDAAIGSIPADYSGLLHTIAADYSSSKTYFVGDYCWEAGVLKRCIVPITSAETYTAAHWTDAVIGDDLSALKSALVLDLTQITNGLQNVRFLDGAWETGGINNSGQIVYTRTNRVLNNKILCLDREVTLQASTGFYFNRYYYASTSSETSSSSGADLTELTIPSGQCFRILIKRTTESNGEKANIDEFTGAVTLTTKATDNINNGIIFDKICLSAFKNGAEKRGQLPADWKYGVVLPESGNLSFISKSKIVSNNIMVFDKDISIYARNGYLFSAYYYNADGTYDEPSTTHSFLKIAANRKFRIVVQNDPVSSGTVQIESLASAIYCETGNEIQFTSNLFNKYTVKEKTTINSSTGEETSNSDYVTGDYIIVDPETKYALSNKYIDTNGFMWVAYYEADKKFISRFTLTSSTRYITTPNYARFVRLGGQYWNISVDTSMFVKGDTLPLTYERYAIQSGDIGIARRTNSISEFEKYKHKGKVCNYTNPFMFSSNISADDVASVNGMSYSDVIALYDALKATYSSYITKTSIGTASDGTSTMYMYTFKPSAIADAADTTRKFILVAGTHGGEKTGVYCLYRTMKTICDLWQTDEKLADVRRGMTFCVIPCVNPYGMNNSSRLNANGVNIARNFSVGWTYIAPSSDNNYSGEYALSEPETQAVNNVMIANADADFFCSFHNFWTNSYAYWNTSGMIMNHQLANEHNIIMTNAFYKQGLTPVTGEYFGHADTAAPQASEGMQPLLYNMRASIYEVCARDLSNNENTPQAITMGTEVQLNWILMNYYSRFDMFE